MLVHIPDVLRMMKRRRSQGVSFKKYKGKDAEDIARRIIDDCFNSRFMQVSTGHFRQFYVRDFGIIARPLMRLGYKDYVKKTLEYALSCYSKHYHITTQITPKGVPINSFNIPAADTLPFFLKALRDLGDKELIEVYRPFLEIEADKYVDFFLDKDGMIKQKPFGRMRDHHKVWGGCYDTCMAGMLYNLCKEMGLYVPLKNKNFKKIIIENFWNGNYFYDDMKKEDYVAADAQFAPFYCGIIDDKKVFSKVLKSMQADGLDKPFPIKYEKRWNKKRTLLLAKLFAPNYEGNATWIHAGLCWMEVVMKYDKALWRKYVKQYEFLILEHKNFLEVFDKDGKPYHSFFYLCDEGMSWVAGWLWMKKEVNKNIQ